MVNILSGDIHDGSSKSSPLLAAKDVLQTTLSFETFSDEEKKTIQELIVAIYNNHDRESANSFLILDRKDITFDGLQKTLSRIVGLFEGGEKFNDYLRIFISNKIAEPINAKANLGKIIFIREPNMSAGHMSHQYGDLINKKYDIDLRSEDGNGGYYDAVSVPEVMGDDFAHVNVTEHFISKKPDAVVVIITASLRPRYKIMANTLKDPSYITAEQMNELWQLSDEEVKAKYYVPAEFLEDY